jgi:phosphopantothenate-cysteine ligase
MNVLVTAGGTIAPIDDVRHIANISSGRFAAMITEACLARGASVCHVHARSAVLPFQRQATFDLSSPDPAAELDRLKRLRTRWDEVHSRLRLVPLAIGTVAEYQATLERTLRADPIDIAFLAMAVSDFEPEPHAGKIETPDGPYTIRCRPTPKVIRSVRDWSPNIFLVGFKLLSGATPETLIDAAHAACQTNRADVTVANDLALLQAGRHTIHVVRPAYPTETISGSGIAAALVDRVMAWTAERRSL